MSRIFINTDLGIEKRCSLCGEYLPFDLEFYFSSGFKNNKKQFHARCKPCYLTSYKGAL